MLRECPLGTLFFCGNKLIRWVRIISIEHWLVVVETVTIKNLTKDKRIYSNFNLSIPFNKAVKRLVFFVCDLQKKYFKSINNLMIKRVSLGLFFVVTN